jgi:hypothetical protein
MLLLGVRLQLLIGVPIRTPLVSNRTDPRTIVCDRDTEVTIIVIGGFAAVAFICDRTQDILSQIWGTNLCLDIIKRVDANVAAGLHLAKSVAYDVLNNLLIRSKCNPDEK